MKPIKLIAYALVVVFGLIWLTFLHDYLGIPNVLSVVSSVILGPVTMLLCLNVLFKMLDAFGK